MGSEAADGPRIAGEADLEAFARCPSDQRELTEPLRGLVAEMALTGIVRYQWALLRPLMSYLLELQLRRFDQSSGVEVGPARPVLLDGEALETLIDRLRSYMDGFDAAPWTAQRLAELLLEPGKQYRQLHKLALALEKLLLVSSGQPEARAPPPLPLLAELRPVNENPPKVAAPGAGAGGAAGAKRAREDEDTGMGLVSATLGVKQPPVADGSEPDGGGGEPAAAGGGGNAATAGGGGGGDEEEGAAAKRSRGEGVEEGAGGDSGSSGGGGGAAAMEEDAAAGEGQQGPAAAGGGDAQQRQGQQAEEVQQPAAPMDTAADGAAAGAATVDGAGAAAAGSEGAPGEAGAEG